MTAASIMVYDDQTQITTVKLNTQNYLLWMNAIYISGVSRES